MAAFKAILAITLAIALIQPGASFAADSGFDTLGRPVSQEATSASMVGDALVARPLYAVATVIGATIFLVTLPFSALGGNVDQAASELVTGPAHGLLTRCLGCTHTVQEGNVERAAE